MSAPIIYNTATKSISIEPELSTPEWEADAESINLMVRDLVALGQDVPMAANACNGKITEAFKKMLDSAIAEYKKSRYPDAIRLANLALGIAVRRYRWESFGYTLSEIGQVISFRCDVYLANSQWAEAFADASLLSLVIPNSALNHFRKGQCYQAINNLVAAKQCYQTGLTIASDNEQIKASLDEVNALLEKV
ncbi:hypothetical protein NADFUDRAFT_48899 [Nadsonia fulvescens var. elongata DSM 6958]|uniref:TPR-like protein n=1 Tax=Nadsonia fulvescens var. elongata DSM 6958 TaxID=857566 RepID=A0A1E3PS54_9ASCO|nr:hypothetical protein NADFUDRAFT_48899 [Nadsonia fulvescens var. elongata DSM 6958]